jgi:uncharacterized protein YdhG (YjbR/CyaY superfamily)
VHQLRNSCIPLEWALAGFLRAWANHCSFYPGSSTTLKQFRDDLKGFEITKGTIRFSPDKPLPTALLKKLIKARIREKRI